MKKIGAIWIKNGKKGPFLSGLIEMDGKKISFLAFRTSEKKSEKSPDYSIMQEDPNEVKPPVSERKVTPPPSMQEKEDIPF